jgi:hypothetical protein
VNPISCGNPLLSQGLQEFLHVLALALEVMVQIFFPLFHLKRSPASSCQNPRPLQERTQIFLLKFLPASFLRPQR